jgi:Serine acetyltransferase
VVLDEVPDNATAVGVPARIARLNGLRPSYLDQIHVADPVAQELCRVDVDLERVKKQLNELLSQREVK